MHYGKGDDMSLAPFQITNILQDNLDTGYSVNLEGDTPKTGYMVGGYVPSLVIHDGAYMPYLTTDRWLSEHKDLLAKTGLYAGVWTDKETGAVYVDLSRNVDDLYTAMAIALSHGELAIWDVENQREIRTEAAESALRSLVAA